MRRQSLVVRTALCLPALVVATLLTQCGPADRKFAKGSGGAAGGGVGGNSGAAPQGGRGGSSGSHAGAGGFADAGASQAGDAGDTGEAGSTATAGTTGAAGSTGTAGMNGTAGMTGTAGTGAGGGPPALLPTGSKCSKGSECALGNCVDSVCCESACSGACTACAATVTGKADGICASVLDGLDPHNNCQDVTATNQCGTDGACNGSGACRNVGTSHVCKPASCSNGSFTPQSTCDGLGMCKTPAAENCGASTCALTGCVKACTTQAECTTTSYCKIPSGGTSGTCTAKNPNGTVATQTFECTSGVVADGVCCNQTCSGCMACSGSPATGSAAGTCANALNGQDPHNTCAASGVTCGLDGSCDGAGACRSTPLPGAACTQSNKCLTGTTCISGACGGGTAVTCNGASGCKKAGVCQTSSGACVYDNVTDGTTCNDGNGCTTPDKCTSGVCGGPLCTADASKPSCSPSTNACVCRIKDAGNLLTNPGFDGSAAGWETQSYPFSLKPDVEACAQSNALFAPQAGTQGMPRQCVNGISANVTYYFGVTYSGGGVPGDNFTVEFFNDTDCNGNTLDTVALSTVNSSNTWEKVSGSKKAPTGSKSARFSSFISLRQMDQVFLGTVNKF